MAAPIFHVLTEFKFEIGSALINTKTMQDAVGSLSNAADQALLNFQKLGMGIVGYMGLGTGSMLSFVQTAVAASEKFGQAQRNISNVFLSNNLFTGPQAFEEAMLSAEKSMNRINKTAQKFSLPVEPMIKLATTIGAQLIAEGLDTSSLKNSTELARGYAKSAGIVGFDPDLAMGQLQRTVGGGASMGDPLFARLVAETKAMSGLRGGDSSKQFNAMKPAERLKVLTEALTQFGNTVEINTGNARSLTNQMQVLRDQITGMFSIFRPVGALFAEFLRKPLVRLNFWLKLEGRMLMENLARLFDGIIKDPKSLYVMLKQLQGLKVDLNWASKIGMLVSGFMGLKWALNLLGIQIAWTTLITTAASRSFAVLGTLMAGARNIFLLLTGASGVFSGLLSIARGAMVLAAEIAGPILLVLGIFQFFRRAFAIARADDAIAFANVLPRLTEALARAKDLFMRMFGPMIDLFNMLAEKASIIFRLSHWIEALIWLVETLTDGFAVLFGVLQGLLWMVMKFVTNIMDLAKGEGSMNIFKDTGGAFMDGFNDIWEGLDTKMAEGKGVANNVTNIGHVAINNNFKEQLEPDRIAFTLKEQLMKTAQNPNQGQGRNLSGALSGR